MASSLDDVVRGLADLESWLVMVAQYTRETRDGTQGRKTATGTAASESSWLDGLQRRIEEGARAGISMGLGQARSLANRGFAGTTEQAQFSYAMDQLAKQFAAVFKPVIDGLTYGAVEIERRMKVMSGAQQNSLLGGLIGAGIGMRFGGVPGGVLGFTAGSSAMGGGSTTGTMLGALGGAYVGFRAGGPYGALAGAAAGAVASTPRSYETETGSEYYARQRANGASVFGAYTSGMAEAIRRLVDSPVKGDAPYSGVLRELGGAKSGTGDESKRRDVTPFQAEMSEAGSTSMRIQEGLIRATAGPGYEEGGGPLKPIVDLLIAIFDVLLQMSGGTPPPRSATEIGR